MKNLSYKNETIAKRYSRALIESAGSEVDAIRNDLGLINETINSSSDLKNVILNPTFNEEKVEEIIGDIFSSKISEKTLNFLKMLIKAHRMDIFEDITYWYCEFDDELKNKLKVSVTSAIVLNDETKERLKHKLEAKFKKTILLNYAVDESIIGGLIIKANDKIIDGSIKSKYERLKKSLV
ncbi:MAG: ATP synthase F1 subunit delta [Candidatus Gastranaerophilales bacterium]|nr:ATP synthase F1 subunit delta [Candidatus Gastranaerophilales bacterium]